MVGKLLLVMLALTPLFGGCGIIRYIAHAFAIDIGETVEAEYEGLAGKTVAVIIDSGGRIDSIEFEHPGTQWHVSDRVSIELEDRIEGLKAVNALQIVKYQKEHSGWEDVPKGRLARTLKADFVLSLTLVEFSTNDPSAGHLNSGRMAAEVALYEASDAERGEPVWRNADLLTAAYPSRAAGDLNVTDESRIAVAQKTIERFAAKLARKFYKHKAADKGAK